MTVESIYGSRPDLLPRSMVRIIRVPAGGAEWVGREGIEVLDLGAHLAVEELIGRFPRSTDGTVEWDKVPAGTVIASSEAVAETLLRAFDECDPHGEYVTFVWDSLAVPSVRMELSLAATLVAEITELFAEFWMLCEPSGVLLEFSSFKDRLVAARATM